MLCFSSVIIPATTKSKLWKINYYSFRWRSVWTGCRPTRQLWHIYQIFIWFCWHRKRIHWNFWCSCKGSWKTENSSYWSTKSSANLCKTTRNRTVSIDCFDKRVSTCSWAIAIRIQFIATIRVFTKWFYGTICASKVMKILTCLIPISWFYAMKINDYPYRNSIYHNNLLHKVPLTYK